MRYHNKSVFTLLLLLLPTLVLMGKETSNSRQARKIFDHTYQWSMGGREARLAIASTSSVCTKQLGRYGCKGRKVVRKKKI